MGSRLEVSYPNLIISLRNNQEISTNPLREDLDEILCKIISSNPCESKCLPEVMYTWLKKTTLLYE